MRHVVKPYLTNKIDLLRWVHHNPAPGTLLNIHIFIQLRWQLQRNIKTTVSRGKQGFPDSPLFPLVSQSLSCVKLRSALWQRPCLVHVSGCRVPPLFSCCQSADWLPSCQLLERGERCHWIVITVLFTLSTLVRAFRHALNRWMKSRLDHWARYELP